MPDPNVFLLSPARTDGRRAQILLNPNASFDLARRIRSNEGASLGEIFSFLSGLYFRGKLTYARALTPGAHHQTHIKVITSNQGLCSHLEMVTRDDLIAFSGVDIADAGAQYLEPLKRDVEQLAHTMGPEANVVLLGSIATGKYVDTLIDTFGERLLFPSDFVGRGDMSRGGLLLRHAEAGTSLEYTPVAGAVRHGRRPPKLERLPRR